MRLEFAEMKKSLLLNFVICGAILTASSASFAQGEQINIVFDQKLEKQFAEEYGEKEKTVITDMIKEEIAKKFSGKDYRYEININQITPNRPTMQQMDNKPGLSYQSFGIGGANISGKVFDQSGKLVAETKYDYYGNDIWHSQYDWTWHDAEWAVERFVKKLVVASN